jgi:hypothetical protein
MKKPWNRANANDHKHKGSSAPFAGIIVRAGKAIDASYPRHRDGETLAFCVRSL